MAIWKLHWLESPRDCINLWKLCFRADTSRSLPNELHYDFDTSFDEGKKDARLAEYYIFPLSFNGGRFSLGEIVDVFTRSNWIWFIAIPRKYLSKDEAKSFAYDEIKEFNIYRATPKGSEK